MPFQTKLSSRKLETSQTFPNEIVYFGIILKLSLNNGQTELVDLFFQKLSFHIERTGKNMKQGQANPFSQKSNNNN